MRSAFGLMVARTGIILLPSYLVAAVTDKMVFVVPTVAAMVFLATGLGSIINNRVDDDVDSSDTDSNHKDDYESGSQFEAGE